MRIKKMMGMILLFALFALCFVGCRTQQNVDAATDNITGTTEETTMEVKMPEPTEPRLPVIDNSTIRMYYDDRLSITQITENASACVEISDTNIVLHNKENNVLIGVGVGTTDLTVDGVTYQLSVEAAPISLVMITGHSIGAGQTGVAAQSVLCPEGQVYSTHGVKAANAETEGIGIGYGAAVKPDGIDAFTASGAGTIGEGSGLAYRWNQLTGEKIWVLNAAIGGSSLDQWTQGAKNYTNSVTLFRYAQKILTAEIAAGHYRLKDMAIIYHSAANFEYNNVDYTDKMGQKWYDSMWNGFKQDLSMDMTGDGEEETVDALGFVPIYTSGKLNLSFDALANFCMAAMDTYPDTFMASLATRVWIADVSTFPQIAYETHGESVNLPLRKEHLFTDGIHLQQVAYNAAGMDIAQNLFDHLRNPIIVESLELLKSDGNKVYDELTLKQVGASVSLVPIVEPLTVSDLTFTVSDNLELVYPCTVKAVAPGIGTLTIAQGNNILKTITIEVKE